MNLSTKQVVRIRQCVRIIIQMLRWLRQLAQLPDHPVQILWSNIRLFLPPDRVKRKSSKAIFYFLRTATLDQFQRAHWNRTRIRLDFIWHRRELETRLHWQ